MPGPKPVTEQEALEWKRMYEQEDKTIDEIAMVVDRGPTTVKKYLKLVGTQMRRVGQRAGIEPNTPTKPGDSSGTGVHKVPGRHALTGHRRRGGRF